MSDIDSEAETFPDAAVKVEEAEELWPEDKGADEELDEFQKMEKEVIEEMEQEKKKVTKEGDKRGKKKKRRRTDAEKENKKTTYHKTEKHIGPRVRSFDPAKMKSKFNKPKEPVQVSQDCRICGKIVFQMEKIVAEKASWHKNCFRCSECNKNLTLETYQSHEGSLYCKPHFKELFRPKAVITDEAEDRKERLLRRPKMIILESNPDILPDDVVRATKIPDYGLDELNQTLNVKERFALFENKSKPEDEVKLESVAVRRSQSMMSKAARFLEGENPTENGEENLQEDESEEEEVDEEDEDGNVVTIRRKKSRPMSFSGLGDLKAAFEQKQRREEMKQGRKEDLSKFRQLLCAGKNTALKEKFESGNFERDETCREEIKIEGGRMAASNLLARFEKGQPFILEDDENEQQVKVNGEIQEVNEIFKEAETAKRARDVFRQIDSKLSKEKGSAGVIMRSPSYVASHNRDHRLSLDLSSLTMPQRSASTAEVIKSSDRQEEDYSVNSRDLASRFKFFSTYEESLEKEQKKKRKVFRITPPRDGIDQGIIGSDDPDVMGRDPNLIRCTDNYEDEIDCKNTKNILQMFRKMELAQDDDEQEEGPRPLKCFTPPPDHCEEDSEEYTDDEDYTDDDEDDEDSQEDENGSPKFKDELLQMLSARKAASLRAKFEKWEEKQNSVNREKTDNDLDECRPSLDTAKNLKAMFENKAEEVAKPVVSRPIVQKVNRFV